MQKSIFTLLTLALLCMATSVDAQLTFGGKIGVNDATQKLSLDGSLGLLGGDAESRTGFNIGAFAEIGEGTVRFQPELNFSSKGSSRLGIEGTDDAFDREHRLAYIEIPLQAKWYFFESDKFAAYGLAGAYIGFALGGSIVEPDLEDQDLNFDDEDGYENIDYGIPLGAGVTFEVGPGKLFGELRYMYGLKKVQQNEIVSSSTTFNAKNRITQFNVGYMFTL